MGSGSKRPCSSWQRGTCANALPVGGISAPSPSLPPSPRPAGVRRGAANSGVRPRRRARTSCASPQRDAANPRSRARRSIQRPPRRRSVSALNEGLPPPPPARQRVDASRSRRARMRSMSSMRSRLIKPRCMALHNTWVSPSRLCTPHADHLLQQQPRPEQIGAMRIAAFRHEAIRVTSQRQRAVDRFLLRNPHQLPLLTFLRACMSLTSSGDPGLSHGGWLQGFMALAASISCPADAVRHFTYSCCETMPSPSRSISAKSDPACCAASPSDE